MCQVDFDTFRYYEQLDRNYFNEMALEHYCEDNDINEENLTDLEKQTILEDLKADAELAKYGL